MNAIPLQHNDEVTNLEVQKIKKTLKRSVTFNPRFTQEKIENTKPFDKFCTKKAISEGYKLNSSNNRIYSHLLTTIKYINENEVNENILVDLISNEIQP